jgi:hypothetical protein
MPDEGMADHLRAELALSALDMAIGQRLVMPGALVHHSDQGVQYACGDYIARLERAGIQPSMSRAGCPWDNAMAESFMRTLKREEADGQAYRDQAEAEASITTFIATVYNQQRLHSALAYLAPEDFEPGAASIGKSGRDEETAPQPNQETAGGACGTPGRRGSENGGHNGPCSQRPPRAASTCV